MRIYLDEDMESRELIGALRKAGHDVQVPLEVRLTGESDAAQLTHSIHEDRVCITANGRHFKELHDLVLQSGGSHSGILTVHQENDRRRDMRPHQMARAIANIESFLQSVRSGFYSLNDWQ
jgi:hypothetical protein